MQSSPLEAPADRPLTCDAEVVVEDNVWIGDGVAILPGSQIGQGSIIGANLSRVVRYPSSASLLGIHRPIKVHDCDSQSWDTHG